MCVLRLAPVLDLQCVMIMMHTMATNLCLCAQLAPPGEKQTGSLGRGRGGGGVVAVLHVYHNVKSIQRCSVATRAVPFTLVDAPCPRSR